MVEYSETDPKPEVEESCKPSCIKFLSEYKACAERISKPAHGHGGDHGPRHCAGQYFDYLACIDKCAAPKLFARLK